LSWRFTYHKELLQHLYTGHSDLYILMGENQGDFEHDFEELIRGVELQPKTLMGACDQCLELHDKKDTSKLSISIVEFSV